MGDLDFDAILSTQLTVGVLSQRAPSSVCLEFILSNATPTARTSAVSSKSEFVRRPLGFSTDTTSLAMSSGKASLQTIRGVSLQRENHTPPAPTAAAS